jgi:hypothetical protein
MEVMVANAVQWSKDGWGGYVYPTTSILANPRLNSTAAAASLKPLTDFLKTGTGGTAQAQWSQYGSFLPLFSALLSGPVSFGDNTALSSRLIPQSLFAPDKAPALLNATLQTLSLAGGRATFYFTTPFSYPAVKGATSVSPAWRGAVWHVIGSVAWDWDAGVDVAKAGYVKVAQAMAPLRALTPGGGAYQVRWILLFPVEERVLMVGWDRRTRRMCMNLARRLRSGGRITHSSTL